MAQELKLAAGAATSTAGSAHRMLARVYAERVCRLESRPPRLQLVVSDRVRLPEAPDGPFRLA